MSAMAMGALLASATPSRVYTSRLVKTPLHEPVRKNGTSRLVESVGVGAFGDTNRLHALTPTGYTNRRGPFAPTGYTNRLV